MTYSSVWAQAAVVWLVAPGSGTAYREVMDALRGEFDGAKSSQLQWVVSSPEALEAPVNQPRLVVTVGAAALSKVVSHYQHSAMPPPILATLLPRLAYERELARSGRKLNASALVLDQPTARQAVLLRATLPAAKRVGILLGQESRGLAAALRTALAEQGLAPHFEDVGQRGVFAALQSLLDDSDVLLAVADPSVYNSESIAGILTAGYRRQVPLVGFSPSYVKAGALVGLYATPSQVGRATADVVRAVMAGAALPPPAPPHEFTVEVNPAVARSLGLALEVDELRKRMRAQERQP